ncbi:TonB-dependent receptor [Sphingobium sp. Sx8-8]|uniref:TonB-dependent receptor n=1 Tax=Sphingobium sp. Sx8-8 TaxID=2933617 RepID=UPI001F58D200|nr:TonB-dependent receptor [Sphingobium sp. Sx8-8]
MTSPGVAQAQQNQSGSVSDIVVTARRVSESLQQVPLAIEALSQKDLTQRGVTSAADLSKAVAGLSINSDSGNPSLPTFTIRGRGQQYGAASGSVETYFADIPLSATFQIPGMAPQFFDVASFQVLKGPQGTLFGRNTTGGAVVIVPEAPKLGKTEGYVRVQGGTYNDFQFEGAINIPFGDDVALRLAAFDWQRDGYLHSSATNYFTGATETESSTGGKPLGSQTFNNVNQTQFRASLLVTPSDTISNLTVLSYEVDKTRASGLGGIINKYFLTGNPADLGKYQATPMCGKYCGYVDTNLTKPATKVYFVANTTTLGLSDTINLKNIVGYIKSVGYTNDAADSDGFDLPFIDLPAPARKKKNEQFTEELQLSGKTGMLSYLFGGMYDKTSQPTGITTINPYSIDYPVPIGGTLYNFYNFQSTNIRSKALYGSVTVTPIEKLNITGGYRYTWIDVAQTSGAALYPAGAPQPNNPAAISTKSGSFKGSTYNIGVDYHFDQDLMVYGAYRHGFKRGGFNPSSGATFNPEKVDDFSAGVKNSFHLGSMPGHANLEFFYDKYKDFQGTYLADGTSGQLITNTINIPKVRFWGFDLNAGIAPAQFLDLSLAYSYDNAKITYFPDPSTVHPSTADLSVNPVPQAPRNKLTATARLHGELPNNIGEAVLFGAINYQSDIYVTPFTKLLPADAIATFGLASRDSTCIADGRCSQLVPAYTTVDMRLELNHAFGSRFDLSAAVTNLTNKYYYSGTGGTAEFGIEGYAIGAPRMWTFEVRTKF